MHHPGRLFDERLQQRRWTRGAATKHGIPIIAAFRWKISENDFADDRTDAEPRQTLRGVLRATIHSRSWR